MSEYAPDHNGECLHCDTPLDAHCACHRCQPCGNETCDHPSLKAFEPAPDICDRCGKTIGYGIRALHLGRCEECSDVAT